MSAVFDPVPKGMEYYIARRILKYPRILLWGDTGSGKTASQGADIAWQCASTTGQLGMLYGRSTISVMNNMLGAIEDACDELGLDISVKYSNPAEIRINGNRILVYSASSVDAPGRIKGLNLNWCAADEVTESIHEFHQMALSRLRRPPAWWVGTTNPGKSTHWVKKEILDSGKYHNIYFPLHENPHIPQEYKDQLYDSLTGYMKDRMLHGQWTDPTGNVWPDYEIVPREQLFSQGIHLIGVDYGTTGITAAVSVIGSAESWHIVNEYRHSGADNGIISEDEHVSRIIRRFGTPHTVYCDPSAIMLIDAFNRAGVPCVGADNNVLKGVQRIDSYFVRRILKIGQHNEQILDEISGYQWQDMQERPGEPKPVKKDDHLMDAIRYVGDGMSGYVDSGPAEFLFGR